MICKIVKGFSYIFENQIQRILQQLIFGQMDQDYLKLMQHNKQLQFRLTELERENQQKQQKMKELKKKLIRKNRSFLHKNTEQSKSKKQLKIIKYSIAASLLIIALVIGVSQTLDHYERVQRQTQQNIKKQIQLQKQKQAQERELQKQKQLEMERQRQAQRQIQIAKQKQIQKLRAEQKQKNKDTLESRLLANSSIITNQKEAQKLLFMFQDDVKDVRLLYKASEWDFQIKYFFQFHGSETNTLILVKTAFDKVIGAFTPLAHKFSGRGDVVTKLGRTLGQYANDPSSKSFIFSLTNNQKFELRNPPYAVFRSVASNSIHFGGIFEGLLISDESDKEECSSRINFSFSLIPGISQKPAYYNPKYKEYNLYNSHDDDYKMFMKSFNGNSSQSFRTKQWQVWKINFKK